MTTFLLICSILLLTAGGLGIGLVWGRPLASAGCCRSGAAAAAGLADCGACPERHASPDARDPQREGGAHEDRA